MSRKQMKGRSVVVMVAKEETRRQNPNMCVCPKRVQSRDPIGGDFEHILSILFYILISIDILFLFPPKDCYI